MERALVIGIMGPGDKADSEDLKNAWNLGALIAQNGWHTLTGARRSGIMEEALRGAKEFGGRTIGIIPGKIKHEATPYADIIIPTGMGNARNVINVLASDIVVAVRCNSAGTVSEACLAIKEKKPLVLLGANAAMADVIKALGSDLVSIAETPADVVASIRRSAAQWGLKS